MGLLSRLLGRDTTKETDFIRIADDNAVTLYLPESEPRGFLQKLFGGSPNAKQFLRRFMAIVPDGAVLDLEEWINFEIDEYDEIKAEMEKHSLTGPRPVSSAGRKNEVLRLRIGPETRELIVRAVESGCLSDEWIHIRIYTDDTILLESFDFLSDVFAPFDFTEPYLEQWRGEGVIEKYERESLREQVAADKRESRMKANKVCAPIMSLFLLSIAGFLLHLRIHPPGQEPFFWVPPIHFRLRPLSCRFSSTTGKPSNWPTSSTPLPS